MIDDDDGTEVRGKACENGCVCEIAKRAKMAVCVR